MLISEHTLVWECSCARMWYELRYLRNPSDSCRIWSSHDVLNSVSDFVSRLYPMVVRSSHCSFPLGPR